MSLNFPYTKLYKRVHAERRRSREVCLTFSNSKEESRLRHIPGVIARLDRAIQYAAANRLKHWRLWNTGLPGQAGQ